MRRVTLVFYRWGVTRMCRHGLCMRTPKWWGGYCTRHDPKRGATC